MGGVGRGPGNCIIPDLFVLLRGGVLAINVQLDTPPRRRSLGRLLHLLDIAAKGRVISRDSAVWHSAACTSEVLHIWLCSAQRPDPDCDGGWLA